MDNYIIREIINKNFTFSDLSRRFENVDSSTGNIFCPFHSNTNSPAAKMYWNEEKEIWIIHCFAERRNFDTYDYVKLVMCENWGKYSSPLDFLKKNMPSNKLAEQINTVKNQRIELTESSLQKKIDYINNIAVKYDTIEEYIEELYMN